VASLASVTVSGNFKTKKIINLLSGRTPFAQRETYCENTLKPQLKQLDRYMAGNNFVAGETLSYVDFMFWEILDHMELFDASLFDGLGKWRLSASVVYHRQSCEFIKE
jgi:hypothetical protein